MQPNRAVFSLPRVAVLHPEELTGRIGSRIRGTEIKRREEKGNTERACVLQARRASQLPRDGARRGGALRAMRDATQRDTTRRDAASSATQFVDERDAVCS